MKTKFFSLIFGLVFLSGCSVLRGNTTVIHPITPDHIFAIDKGTQVGDKTATQDGWFISNFYMEEVMEAKVK